MDSTNLLFGFPMLLFGNLNMDDVTLDNVALALVVFLLLGWAISLICCRFIGRGGRRRARVGRHWSFEGERTLRNGFVRRRGFRLSGIFRIVKISLSGASVVAVLVGACVAVFQGAVHLSGMYADSQETISISTEDSFTVENVDGMESDVAANDNPISQVQTQETKEAGEQKGNRIVFMEFMDSNEAEFQQVAYDASQQTRSTNPSSVYAAPQALPTTEASAPLASPEKMRPLEDAKSLSPSQIANQLGVSGREASGNGVSSRAYSPTNEGASFRSYLDRDSTRTSSSENVETDSYRSLLAAFTPDAPIVPFAAQSRFVAGIRSASYASSAGPAPLNEIDRESLILDDSRWFERINNEISRGYDRVCDSVFTIETRKIDKSSGRRVDETGCGFLLQYRDRLFVITNNHVVDGAEAQSKVRIFLPDSRAISPKTIFSCPDYDLAALEVRTEDLAGTPSVKLCSFGDCDSLSVGHFVIAVGSPCLLDKTVTIGNIGGLHRNYNDLKNLGITSTNVLSEYIQISMMINPGNSGGPLINVKGEVVGVTTATLVTNAPTGIAFAIPINDALRIVKTLIDEGVWRPAQLGVELGFANFNDATVASGVTRPCGARILKVNGESPAEAAGLTSGDVVLSFNGRPIEDDVHLARLIALAEPGQSAILGVVRNGDYVKIETRPLRRDRTPQNVGSK